MHWFLEKIMMLICVMPERERFLCVGNFGIHIELKIWLVIF